MSAEVRSGRSLETREARLCLSQTLSTFSSKVKLCRQLSLCSTILTGPSSKGAKSAVSTTRTPPNYSKRLPL